MIDLWSELKESLPSSPAIRPSQARRRPARELTAPSVQATARHDPSPVRLAGDRRGHTAQPDRADAPDPARRGVRDEGETDLRIGLGKINRRQCEAAHTSSRDRRAISGSASSFRWGQPRRGGHDENQPVEQERAEGRSRPALARGAPPARAAAHTAYCSDTFSAQAAPLSF